MASASGLALVGHSDLGGEGLVGPVAVVGRTAVVGAGITPGAGIHTHFYNPYPCPATSVKLVDLSRPEAPRVVGSIPVPEGVAAIDVAAAEVATGAFTGPLAAIALARCGAAGDTVHRGVVYYDLTDPARPAFLGRYHADADLPVPDTAASECGARPAGDPRRCASSQHSVALTMADDGRLLSLSAEPGASASEYPSGDLRIVDVTDPRRPVQVGAHPPPGAPIFGTGGCRPFRAVHDAVPAVRGSTVLLAAFDGGLRAVDLSVPGSPTEVGAWEYATGRETEGNAAYVAAGEAGGRALALVSEEDWIAPDTRLVVDGPPSVAGEHPACPAMFTLFDPADTVQVYRRPERRIEGELVYLGRGCPANEGWGTAEPDPYLADPEGRLALVDRTARPTQPGLSGPGCSIVERVKRAQAAGARAAVVAQTNEEVPQAFSADGDVDNVLIPAVMVDRPAGHALRSALCPDLDDAGACAGGAEVAVALEDRPGEWGALRVFDVTDPGDPVPAATYRTPQAERFPPPDLGVYAPGPALLRDGRAYVAWGAAGLRVLDLGGTAVREVAHFLPADAPDPTGTLPPKAHVTGAAVLEADGGDRRRLVVLTDRHSGLYVVAEP